MLTNFAYFPKSCLSSESESHPWTIEILLKKDGSSIAGPEEKLHYLVHQVKTLGTWYLTGLCYNNKSQGPNQGKENH